MATHYVDTSPDAHWKDSSGGDTDTSEPPLASEDEAPPEYAAEDRSQTAPLSEAPGPSPAERQGGPTVWDDATAAGLPPPSYEEVAQLRINVVTFYAPSSVDTPPPYTISGSERGRASKAKAMAMARALLALGLALAMVPLATADCPPPCECKSTGVGLLVDCSARNLTTFPVFSSDMSHLVLELDVSQNNLQKLPASAPKLPLLRALSLADNDLSALPARWLRRLTALQRLDLSGNAHLSLHALGYSAFLHSSELQVLNLSRCEAIADLDGVEHVLVSGTLEVLDLSRCSLLEATGKLISGLPSLRRLDLSYNPLRLLQGLNSSTLQELSLVHTGLDSIHPSALMDLRALTELDVSDNRGFAFPEREVLSPTLMVLHARFCALHLHNLKAFPNLRYANLQGNGIQGVGSTSFANDFLAELDLSNNNISRIHPHAFGTLPQLERLSLANNKIELIHIEVFLKNGLLWELNMSQNLITDLRQIRAEFLITLDVSQCNVDKLTADSLSGMPDLRILNLSSNRLEYVPDNFTSDSLNSLDLSSCRLSVVGNDTFRRLPNLWELDLSGNRFTETISAEAFSSNGRLLALSLADNPWHCACASEQFQRFVEFTMSVDQAEAATRAICASPEGLKGQTWLRACFDTWYPPLSEHESVGRLGAAGRAGLLSMATLAGIVVFLALRGAMRWHSKAAERRRQPPSYEEALLSDLLGERTGAAASGGGAAVAIPVTHVHHLIYEGAVVPKRKAGNCDSGDRLRAPQANIGAGDGGAGLPEETLAPTDVAVTVTASRSSAVWSPVHTSRPQRPRAGCGNDGLPSAPPYS